MAAREHPEPRTPGVSSEVEVLVLTAALADVTAAYHKERGHEGRWNRCQRPRCQNARLAVDGRGPFAAALAHFETGEERA